MRNNDALPAISIRATFEVSIDGEGVEPDPATSLPLAQLYNLF